MSTIGNIFDNGSLLSIALSVFLAVIPAIVGLVFIYKRDRKDKEPLTMLAMLILGGFFATIVALILEMMTAFVEVFAIGTTGIVFVLLTFVSAMLIGVIEEISKYLFLKLFSWDSRNFNYVFDGIVYAVFVSLGFALTENIMYVFSYGFDVVIPRALLTIPAHLSFGVFMGADYGIAKIYDAMGDDKSAKSTLWRGLFIAILLHGIYDGLAMTSDISVFYILFYVFVVALDVIVFQLINQRSKDDRSIQGIIYDVRQKRSQSL